MELNSWKSSIKATIKRTWQRAVANNKSEAFFFLGSGGLSGRTWRTIVKPPPNEVLWAKAEPQWTIKVYILAAAIAMKIPKKLGKSPDNWGGFSQWIPTISGLTDRMAEAKSLGGFRVEAWCFPSEGISLGLPDGERCAISRSSYFCVVLLCLIVFVHSCILTVLEKLALACFLFYECLAATRPGVVPLRLVEPLGFDQWDLVF